MRVWLLTAIKAAWRRWFLYVPVHALMDCVMRPDGGLKRKKGGMMCSPVHSNDNLKRKLCR